jgi:hypothetical protein
MYYGNDFVPKYDIEEYSNLCYEAEVMGKRLIDTCDNGGQVHNFFEFLCDSNFNREDILGITKSFILKVINEKSFYLYDIVSLCDLLKKFNITISMERDMGPDWYTPDRYTPDRYTLGWVVKIK